MLAKKAQIVTFAAVALLAAACSTATPAPAAAPKTTQIAGTEVKADPALTALLPEKIKTAGKVRVAVDPPYPPFMMFVTEGGSEMTGLDYDLGQAIAARLGTTFEWGKQAWDGIIPAVQAGKFDIILSTMTDNRERQKVLSFVDYSKSGTGVLIAKGNPEGIKTFTDLCGKKISVEAATNQVKAVEKRQHLCTEAGKQPVVLEKYKKDADGQLALKSGKVSGHLMTKPAAIYLASTADGGNAFEVVDDAAELGGYDASPNGIAVLKDDQTLVTAIQKALQSLMDDGTYAKILAKYGAASIAIDKATVNAAID
ncbi:ABC transporter substrate-binding protein [Nonomuraea sediminis]|uniref:ABC transporter substrate-binding protein n=1 Tax=Nonomuraea sediminis TaxID=2835864 RepID=UPI001BDD28D7|nr:ABC transporter substrate-binding protein [Nonomuraea sediminis]